MYTIITVCYIHLKYLLWFVEKHSSGVGVSGSGHAGERWLRAAVEVATGRGGSVAATVAPIFHRGSRSTIFHHEKIPLIGWYIGLVRDNDG